jgi:hypothetical protein
MNSQPIQRICFVTGLVVAALSPSTRAQTAGLSATLVLRSQAASLAEETFSRLDQSLSKVDQIGVTVEGGTARALVENAFLDLFARKGIRAVLQGPRATTDHLVQITVLDQSVRYAGVSDGEYRREVQTAIEARQATRDSAVVQYLGLFKRQDVDTVAFREEGGLLAVSREVERTLFDRLLGPILLISGAFLIVYLFFTVRN